MATVEAVRALYDQLWDVAPPQATWRDKIAYSRALAYAAHPQKRSIRYSLEPAWVVPMAWDEDTIDDPAATPDTGQEDSLRAVGANLQDVEWLLDQEPFTLTQVADRLHVVRSAVEHACARGNRRDLLTRMARNATVRELAS